MVNSIIQWNIRGFKGNFEEWCLLSNLYKPTVIGLQETLLTDLKTPSMNGFSFTDKKLPKQYCRKSGISYHAIFFLFAAILWRARGACAFTVHVLGRFWWFWLRAIICTPTGSLCYYCHPLGYYLCCCYSFCHAMLFLCIPSTVSDVWSFIQNFEEGKTNKTQTQPFECFFSHHLNNLTLTLSSPVGKCVLHLFPGKEDRQTLEAMAWQLLAEMMEVAKRGLVINEKIIKVKWWVVVNVSIHVQCDYKVWLDRWSRVLGPYRLTEAQMYWSTDPLCVYQLWQMSCPGTGTTSW